MGDKDMRKVILFAILATAPIACAQIYTPTQIAYSGTGGAATPFTSASTTAASVYTTPILVACLNTTTGLPVLATTTNPCIAGSGGGGSFTLTTTGTSGPATLTGTVLNIPVYSGGGLSDLTAGFYPIATSSTTVGNGTIDFGKTSANTLTVTVPANDTVNISSSGTGGTSVIGGSTGESLGSATGPVSIVAGTSVNVVTGGVANFMSFPNPGITGTVGVLEGTTPAGNCVQIASDGKGLSSTGNTCGTATSVPAATQTVQGGVFLPVTASNNVLPRINVSVCSYITNIGNSIDAGTGSTVAANSWVSIFDSLICPKALDINGSAANRGVPGTFMSDNIGFGILQKLSASASLQPLNVLASNSGLSTIGGPDNEDNNTDALNANQQINYQQELAAGIILRGIPTTELYMVGTNTGTSYSGSTTTMDFWGSIPPAQTMLTAGETETHSFTTYGGPVYALYNIYALDTGLMTVSIDGNVVTDTITGSSNLANAPYAGADFLSSSGYTQTLAAARFTTSGGVPIAAGAHTIKYTCVTVGTNGCTPQITATPPWDPTQYSIPTVAVRGAIRQLSDAKSAATAAYDALVTAVVNPLYADGLNVVKIPVRNFLNANNFENAMSGSDGHDAAAVVNTAISITSGASTVTSATALDSSYIGKLAYCLNAATASTTLHTTVSSWSSVAPDNLVLAAAPGVTGTVTCWFGALGDVWPASTDAGQHPNDWGHRLLAQAALSVLQPVTVAPSIPGFTNFPQGMATNVAQTSGIFNIDYAGNTPPTTLTGIPYCSLLFGSNSNVVTGVNIAGTCFSRDTVKNEFFTGIVSQFNAQTKIGDNNVNTYQNGSIRWDFAFDDSAGGVTGVTNQGVFFNNGLDSYTTTTLASQATLNAPASKFVNVTGTAAISAISLPSGSASLGSAAASPAATTYEGCIYFTASGGTAGTNAWSVTAGATILTGFQAVFGQQYQGCYDGTNWRFTGPGVSTGLKFSTLTPTTNCSSTASPAVCGSAPAGTVQVAASATTLTVNTTAVTANSEIGCLTYNTIGLTAPTNVTSLITPYISAITAGTSFTLTFPVAPLVNPVNLGYCIVN